MKGTRKRRYVAAAMAAGLLISGCMNGPIRFKTLGYKQFATCRKPAFFILTIPVDAAISILDAPAIPITAIPLGLTQGGPDGKGFGDCPWYLLWTVVIWYPVSYFWLFYGLADGDGIVYGNVLGKEGTWLSDRKTSETLTGERWHDLPRPNHY